MDQNFLPSFITINKMLVPDPSLACSPLESQYLGNDAVNQVYSRVSILANRGATVHPGGLRNKTLSWAKEEGAGDGGQGGHGLVGSLLVVSFLIVLVRSFMNLNYLGLVLVCAFLK